MFAMGVLAALATNMDPRLVEYEAALTQAPCVVVRFTEEILEGSILRSRTEYEVGAGPEIMYEIRFRSDGPSGVESSRGWRKGVLQSASFGVDGLPPQVSIKEAAWRASYAFSPLHAIGFCCLNRIEGSLAHRLTISGRHESDDDLGSNYSLLVDETGIPRQKFRVHLSERHGQIPDWFHQEALTHGDWAITVRVLDFRELPNTPSGRRMWIPGSIEIAYDKGPLVRVQCHSWEWCERLPEDKLSPGLVPGAFVVDHSKSPPATFIVGGMEALPSAEVVNKALAREEMIAADRVLKGDLTENDPRVSASSSVTWSSVTRWASIGLIVLGVFIFLRARTRVRANSRGA